MIRTQISLPQEDYEAAKKEARQQGVSLAEYFRRALRRAMPAKRQDRWMRFCGMVESGNHHSSRDIDSVYDEKD